MQLLARTSVIVSMAFNQYSQVSCCPCICTSLPSHCHSPSPPNCCRRDLGALRLGGSSFFSSLEFGSIDDPVASARRRATFSKRTAASSSPRACALQCSDTRCSVLSCALVCLVVRPCRAVAFRAHLLLVPRARPSCSRLVVTSAISCGHACLSIRGQCHLYYCTHV